MALSMSQDLFFWIINKILLIERLLHAQDDEHPIT